MKPDDEIDQLFAEARGAIAPPDGAAERVHQAVLTAIAAPPPPADGGASAAGSGSALGAKLIGAALLAIVAGGGLWALLRSEDPAPVQPTEAPVVASVAPSAEPEPEPEHAAPPETGVEPQVASAPARRPIAVPSASAPAGDTLAEELALMKRARTALGSGASAEALRLLDEHARRFPRGVLAPERSVSRIRALCALGRISEARTEYRRITRGASRSPHFASLRRSCPGLEPESE